MLFNGMLHVMLWEGWVDTGYIARHTSGFEALKATVRDCTPEAVARTCGIRKEDLLEATRLYRAGLDFADALHLIVGPRKRDAQTILAILGLLNS